MTTKKQHQKMQVFTFLWLFNRRKATMLVLITAQQLTASVMEKSNLFFFIPDNSCLHWSKLSF